MSHCPGDEDIVEIWARLQILLGPEDKDASVVSAAKVSSIPRTHSGRRELIASCPLSNLHRHTVNTYVVNKLMYGVIFSYN